MVDSPTDPDAAQAALAGALRVVIGRLRRRLRDEARPGDLTPSQTSALGVLDREGPATVTTLARVEGVRPQSMGATIAALEAAGLVSGAADPADGRQTLYSITEACRALIAGRRAAREDWLLRVLRARFTAEEQAALARGVALLERLAGAPPDARS
jgi:DNA-binding MarR family transcriptional regulator